MKKNTLKFLLLLTLINSLSSCQVLDENFLPGMGFGTILVVSVIALIIYIISRLWKRRKGNLKSP